MTAWSNGTAKTLFLNETSDSVKFRVFFKVWTFGLETIKFLNFMKLF